jgi:hypothetical protein
MSGISHTSFSLFGHTFGTNSEMPQVRGMPNPDSQANRTSRQATPKNHKSIRIRYTLKVARYHQPHGLPQVSQVYIEVVLRHPFG